MFLLVGDDKTYYLPGNGKYTIGRHIGNIIIKEQTVSRKHAEITIKDDEALLRDCESKFFTKYNDKIILKNEEMKLENGGEITFGAVKLRFVAFGKIITCSTGIKENEDELRSVLGEIGGQYLKDWNDTCTHLTTPEIMVTLKVLHAIMDNKKIVTPNFWEAFLKNMKENEYPPEPSEFYPPLGETMIHSKFLEYNPNRKTIFVNKTFIFWKKKRLTYMNAIISKAGGKSLLITSFKNKSHKDIIEHLEKSIVLEPEDSNVESTYSKIIESYKERGRRIIPIQEIVLAILHCSCEENCNPLFDRAKTVFVREEEKPEPSKVFIGETQCFKFDTVKEQKPKIIPSSFDMENYFDTQNIQNTTSTRSFPSQRKESKERPPKTEASMEVEIVPEVIEVPSRKTSAPLFKRPATESLAPPPKKPREDHENMKLNPFCVFKSRIQGGASTSKDSVELDSTDNPFGKINLKKEVKEEITDVRIINDTDSSSTNSHPKKRKNEDKEDNVVLKKRTKTFIKKNRKFVEIGDIDFSQLNHTISRGTWMDKTVKDEDVKSTPLSLEEEDKKWCERFNNSVVIVSKNLLRAGKENITGLSLNPFSSNVQNFKKFRKGFFLKSGQIIKCSKVVYGNSDLGIDYRGSDDEDNRDM